MATTPAAATTDPMSLLAAASAPMAGCASEAGAGSQRGMVGAKAVPLGLCFGQRGQAEGGYGAVETGAARGEAGRAGNRASDALTSPHVRARPSAFADARADGATGVKMLSVTEIGSGAATVIVATGAGAVGVLAHFSVDAAACAAGAGATGVGDELLVEAGEGASFRGSAALADARADVLAYAEDIEDEEAFQVDLRAEVQRLGERIAHLASREADAREGLEQLRLKQRREERLATLAFDKYLDKDSHERAAPMAMRLARIQLIADELQAQMRKHTRASNAYRALWSSRKNAPLRGMREGAGAAGTYGSGQGAYATTAAASANEAPTPAPTPDARYADVLRGSEAYARAPAPRLARGSRPARARTGARALGEPAPVYFLATGGKGGGDGGVHMNAAAAHSVQRRKGGFDALGGSTPPQVAGIGQLGGGSSIYLTGLYPQAEVQQLRVGHAALSTLPESLSLLPPSDAHPGAAGSHFWSRVLGGPQR
ncbi:hypothetical protein T492DRAFT_840797 [Pavlovales sp. CCMP2436]|nr:hypothetical protein T492DRAFT_840797 [Pavlovales sp. CCMP2436]